MPTILSYKGVLPRISEDAFVAPGACVIGDVEIGPRSSIWFGCVVRGDVNTVRIGARTNLQDGTVIHVDSAGHGTVIGDDVVVGHMCLVHACVLENRCFVGSGATVLDGAVVESGAMVAAGSLVLGGRRVPSGELWAGKPAKFLRRLRADEIDHIDEVARRYADYAATYRREIGAASR